jgi:hypothetical protein
VNQRILMEREQLTDYSVIDHTYRHRDFTIRLLQNRFYRLNLEKIYWIKKNDVIICKYAIHNYQSSRKNSFLYDKKKSTMKLSMRMNTNKTTICFFILSQLFTPLDAYNDRLVAIFKKTMIQSSFNNVICPFYW